MSGGGGAPRLPTHVDDLYVGGRWVTSSSAQRLEVVDPATGEAWGSAPQASPTDVDAAARAARVAFDDGPWPRLAPAERARVLERVASEVEGLAEQIATTTTRENGSPVAETAGAAANAAGILRHVASLAPHLEADDVRPFPDATRESVVRRDPVGVCALVAPWNFPINLVVTKLAPALLAGCTVVIKPAETTPLSIRHVVEACAAAGVPDGVVNLVTGDGRVGHALVTHPAVDKIAFTGSTGVGRRIAAACGERLRPVTLELGGKSSAVILPDADLDAVAHVLLRSCLRNTGQTCYVATRILAPASRHDEVVDMVVRTVRSAPQGDPSDPATVFGPVANRSQYESVRRMLATASGEGARAVLGGGVLDRPGYWIEPTVLVDVARGSTVAREEVFGPVVTIQPYSDVDDAVALANDTAYGLGGIVFSSDADRAQAVAERLDTGSVGVNFFASNHAAPFGGRRDSGLGVEYGVEGLHQYLTFKSIHRVRSR
ncbi:aldehyde dehydrogenase family protein [Nocardioides sp. CFH 31398]|uniref:aldehyde dehydrogenase family protein n=1 Tax=Nocardioides sp. CFH 31398 TaxID=2919579 RepID=UPI001F05B921|nr:aldehyde dehydrogenase family protein [Nocardioides sp. CFH 31398]MCH1865496.1 aldehyde dehydrogenase family protein [Nocardioides sp. CFH 31398]